MPELPEVETTLRGIKPYLQDQEIKDVVVRHPSLRWPIPQEINKLVKNQPVTDVARRGKYLLIATHSGTLILHLGMSGSLRLVTTNSPPKKHDHIDLIFSNQKILRFTDPRRFGAFLWAGKNPLEHPLLKHLGPEPLSSDFNGSYLWNRSRTRKVAVKSFIMNSKIVVGIGNIYAAEALFAAGIHPLTEVHKIGLQEYQSLAKEIKKILHSAIKKGGTTLKDFLNSDGQPGYFSFKLKVYGRSGLPCLKCKKPLAEIRLSQRSTVYCSYCQKK